MKLENTGKSLSDLASLLTERSSSGKEKENEAGKADFDPLHPFKAKKKRSAAVPAGAKPFFPKEGASGFGALAGLRAEPETAAPSVSRKTEKKASSLYKTPASRPAVKTARTEPVKPVSPAAREVKPNRPEGPRLQTAPAARKPSVPRPDQTVRTEQSPAPIQKEEPREGIRFPKLKNAQGKSQTASQKKEAGKPSHPEPKQDSHPKKPKQHHRHADRRTDAARPVQMPVRNPVPPFELMEGLPVSARADEIIKAIRENQVVIVAGETGSGKTTQLPKLCMMAGRGTAGLIGHTQPRRIAASSVAKRIAEELHTELGTVVGYKVRFSDHTTSGITVKLMTDGILLAETQTDPQLRAYDTLIIDEAHERSINIDFLLGYLKRLLAKRRDLKVIITSATIDTERFAKHFGRDEDHPAPIIQVSGRTYPVEVRYRAIEDDDSNDDKTLMGAISDAVDELEMAGRGDILVFLTGEREIREAAETLRKNDPQNRVDILPLYARLPAEQQERVFKSGGKRRIVLATNVAETSITVPGIRYVVDTGLARVKRYSYRNKVEQLLIEPISQAAANQRSGRCGRVADGICIRLYSETDFARRPAYTDPEIMRSNLAAVILRMKSLGLGDVKDFPFVQAPPARAISDGYAILSELNCVDDRGGLTKIGRTLSQLPVDPKLSRMLLAASENDALAEVLIIAAGLSVQDPRERPPEQAAAADEAHRKLSDAKSDFLSYVKLWNYVEKAYRDKESNRRFQDQMKRQFLSPRRLHEWHDVVNQLLDMVKGLGWRINTAPATFEQVHCSLLTGLLGSVGMRRVDADFRAPPYMGARGIRFWIWPGSPRAKKCGPWIVAAEIVETSRLFARCVADVTPEWIERIGAHLIKKSWTEPHWEKKRGEVVALEKGTLYGLPVYGSRTVSYAKHDPKLSREIFIREALVEGEFESQAPFFQHNQTLIHEIRDLEQKSRRPDVLVDDEDIFAFYDEKLGDEVCDAASLEAWRKEAEADNPKLLWLSRDDLMRHSAQGITLDMYPKTITMAGISMALNYYFDPGSPRDGVTLVVPLFALNQVDERRCEWLVPGMLKEKIRALVKSLPPRLRRNCIPIPEYAEGFFERYGIGEVPEEHLLDVLIRDLREEKSMICEQRDFKLEQLAPHLFMNYKVIDEHGRQLDMDRSLAKLRSNLGAKARETFQGLADHDAKVVDELEDSITTWSFDELPELMEIHRKGQTLIGIPALVDHGDTVSLEVFDDPQKAASVHRAGLRRLFRIQLREQVRFIDKNLRSLQSALMQSAAVPQISRSFDNFEDLKTQVIDGALERTALADPLPKNRQDFYSRLEDTKGRLSLVAQDLARTFEDLMREAVRIPKLLNGYKGQKELREDVEEQLGQLFPKHFLVTVPAKAFSNYPRYVAAIVMRLEKFRDSPARDAEKTSEIHQLEVPYFRRVAELRGQKEPRLEEFFWQLQELRVSLFAQQLRTPIPVSVKRLQKIWNSIKY